MGLDKDVHQQSVHRLSGRGANVTQGLSDADNPHDGG